MSSRVAIGMGAYRADHHTNLPAPDHGIANRSGLVLHPGRHLFANRLAIATRGPIGLLHQRRSP